MLLLLGLLFLSDHRSQGGNLWINAVVYRVVCIFGPTLWPLFGVLDLILRLLEDCDIGSANPSVLSSIRKGSTCMQQLYVSVNTSIALKPLDSGSGPIMSAVTFCHGCLGMSCGLSGGV